MELCLVLQTTFYNALRTHCFGLRNHPYRCLRIIHKLHIKLPTIFTVVSFATLSMKLFPFPTLLSTTIHCIVRGVVRYFIFGRVYGNRLQLCLCAASNTHHSNNIVRGISLHCFIMVYSIFIPWPMAFLLQNFGNEFIFDVLASSNRFTLPEDSALTLQYIFFGSKQQTRLLQIFSRNLS